MRISVVILVKNEARTLGEVVKRSEMFADQLIIVDGGSSDGSADLARVTKHVILQDSGQGKGQALRLGLQHVDGDVTVFIDADGSHDANEIPELIKPILNEVGDLVIGSRIRGGSDELGGTTYDFTRLLGNVLITMFINQKYRTLFSDTQNGFRAIRTDVGRSLQLSENGHTIELEMILKCLNRGYRVIEVPSHEYRREFGQSNIKNRTIWYEALWCVCRNWR